jgi:hypothetical protein
LNYSSIQKIVLAYFEEELKSFSSFDFLNFEMERQNENPSQKGLIDN